MKPKPRVLLALLPLLLLVSATCQEGGPSGPDPDPDPDPQPGFAFSYTPPPGAPAISTIVVAGSFNAWSTTAAPMTRQADGSWMARIPVGDGQHEYKFQINGAWPADMCDDRGWGDPAHAYWVDPDAAGCLPDGYNGQNAVVRVGTGSAPGLGFQHAPEDPAYLSAAGGRLSVRFRATQQQVQAAAIRAGGQTLPMHLQLSYRLQDVWRGTLPEGATSYSISVQTAAGTQEMGPYTVAGAVFHAVPWVGGSVGYQIFPERFWNGDPGNDHFGVETDAYPFMAPAFQGAPPLLTQQWNGPVTDQHCCHQYFGGDLQGVIDRLDYLQAQGVTFIYLNPIFSAGSAHGYDTFDYLTVEPSFGDEQVLRALVEQVHARGMRVMWDFVPNHVGVGHAAFQDAVHNGSASPYWPWFTFKVPAAQVQVGNGEHYAAWWGFGSLPELNTRNADVMAHLMGVVRHWTEFGFDGIRVDVPGEIDNRVEFFHAFRQTAKSVDPEVYLVGEIWERSPGWLQGDQFDALMNYAIGQDVVERFATGVMTSAAAAQAMGQLYAEYPEAATAMLFNVIATHDTGRLLSKLGGGALGDTPGAEALARQRLASAILFALPGVPVTFQGDECAFLGAGGGREENRYPVQWQACDAQMAAHYRQLAGLKRDVPALASPVIRVSGGGGGVLSFFRGEPGAGEVLAVFNGTPAARTVALPAGSWTDAVTGQVASGTAELGAYGWRYLRRG
jgi:cyclomaltodextrinase